MSYRVLKFGGSSVASATNVSRVLDIVEAETKKGCVILVSSAISGCTDALLSGEETQFQEMERRHADMVKRLFTGPQRIALQERMKALFGQMRQAPADEKVTFGEIFSTTILAEKLETEGYRTIWLDSRDLVVKGDEATTYKRIKSAVKATQADIFVAPGFICQEASGKVSTLGRGGSDYSAALYAAAVQAALPEDVEWENGTLCWEETDGFRSLSCALETQPLGAKERTRWIRFELTAVTEEVW